MSKGKTENFNEKALLIKAQVDICECKKKEMKMADERLRDLCRDVSVEDFMSMSYEEEKELLPVLKEFADVTKLNIFQKAFKAKRMEKYPELEDPVYYPDLKNYTALPKEMLKIVDNALGKVWFKNGEFVYKRPFLKVTGLSSEEFEPLMEYLCEVGIMRRRYEFRCRCGGCSSFMPEDQYKEMRDFYLHRDPDKEMTDEEYDNYTFFVSCDRADDSLSYYISDLKTLETKAHVIYVKKKSPETAHEKW